MATFPILTTGAFAQYPLDRSITFSTEVVQFLDGSVQTYALRGAGQRRWSVRLDLLNEAELEILSDFAKIHRSEIFDFHDPVTGQVVPKCRLAEDRVTLQSDSECRAKAQLVIEEVV